MRGILIVLVVVGHSFPDADAGIASPVASAVYSFVHTFHMAGFFAISGFLAVRSFRRDPWTELGRHTARILVPYLSFSLVSLVLKSAFGPRANHPYAMSDAWRILVGASPNGGLWFLYALFAMYAVTFAIMRLSRGRAWVPVAVGVAGSVVSDAIPVSGMAFDLCRFYLGYAFGVCLGTYRPGIPDREPPGWLPYASSALLVALWLAGAPYGVTGIVGTVASYLLARALSGSRRLVCLGRRSMGIYLLGYYVQIPLRVVLYGAAPYWAVVAAMLVGGLAGGVALDKLAGRWRVTRALIGEAV